MNKLFGKIVLVVVLLFCMMTLTGCDEKYNGPTGTLTELTADECYEKLEAKETFILFIGENSCPHCKEYTENLNKYMETHALNMFVVKADTEANKGGPFNKLRTTYFPTLEYIPVTYYIVDGVIVDEIVLVMDSDQITEWLKRNNIELEK